MITGERRAQVGCWRMLLKNGEMRGQKILRLYKVGCKGPMTVITAPSSDITRV